MRPNWGDFDAYAILYVEKALGNNYDEIKQHHEQKVLDFVSSIPEEKGDFAYAENKWTVKDVLQHIIDAERIFAYRALRFARKDTSPLAGWEEDDYAITANAKQRTLVSLKEELLAVRKTTDFLFESFTEEQLNQRGKANNAEVTVNALGFIIWGHLNHHLGVLKERYLL